WPNTETVGEAVAALARDPELLAAHRAMLPAGGGAPGDYAPERLIACAKVVDARDLNEALALLTPREKAAALGDVLALDRLIALCVPQP
ncbi:MAG: glucan biosynthesis glucosyltransferase H, partial [Calothrix sp. SM1_5_4]|nr:glucan biosynthesis glucosyltransferase H [Calothrix sp. SM1_5_4]